jgi:hypothetical protein
VVDVTTWVALAVADPDRAVSTYVCDLPSHAKYSRWSCAPPLYEAKCVPSIERSTDVARFAVHLSSISVGALHETGEAGLTVKLLIRTLPDGLVVVVCGLVVGVVEAVLDEVAVVVGGAEVDVELLEVVVGLLLLCPLLQPPSTKTPRTATASATVRPIKGGYVGAPPYPGHRCPASSIPRRAT